MQCEDATQSIPNERKIIAGKRSLRSHEADKSFEHPTIIPNGEQSSVGKGGLGLRGKWGLILRGELLGIFVLQTGDRNQTGIAFGTAKGTHEF